MRGAIVRRGRHSFATVVSYGKDPVTGKKRQKWFSHQTRREAEAHLAQILSAVQDGTWTPPAKLRVSDYLERWLRDYAEGRTAATTFAGYQMIVRRHIVPALGHVPLPLLSPQAIQGYLAGKLKPSDAKTTPLSPTTVRHHAALLHKAFAQAVRWGLLARNPADLVDLPRMEPHDIRVLDDEQVRLFLAEARRSSPHYRLYLAAATTGMRQGELLGLRWEDVDFTLGTAAIRQTFYRLNGSKREQRAGRQLFKSPKTAGSRRPIALAPVLVEELRRLREEQVENRRMLGAEYHDHGLVFCQGNGKPLHAHNVTQRDLRRVLKRAGVPRIRFHDLRHGCATLMLQGGTNLKVVQERLGHSTPAFTLRVYSHVLPGMQEQAARELEARLVGTGAGPGERIPGDT